jgi:predicted amidohydrolase
VQVALLHGGDWRAAIPRARAAGADLICLPQLSFTRYVPATRDRAGLELAQRSPAAVLREAVELAGGAFVAASASESEGEGVFYLTAAVGRAGEPMLRYRQRVLEAAPQRYEQMFFTPGHGSSWPTIELPWGPTGSLVGADLRDPGAWSGLEQAGARFVIGGCSEPAEPWQRSQRIVAGLAAAHGIAAVVANRAGEEQGITYAGGGLAVGPDGLKIPVDADGMVIL